MLLLQCEMVILMGAYMEHRNYKIQKLKIWYLVCIAFYWVLCDIFRFKLSYFCCYLQYFILNISIFLSIFVSKSTMVGWERSHTHSQKFCKTFITYFLGPWGGGGGGGGDINNPNMLAAKLTHVFMNKSISKLMNL